MREFRFVIDPGEDFDTHAARWDRELSELQSSGLTIAGYGPDGDEPSRAFLLDESDPLGPIVQIFPIVPLAASSAPVDDGQVVA